MNKLLVSLSALKRFIHLAIMRKVNFLRPTRRHVVVFDKSNLFEIRALLDGVDAGFFDPRYEQVVDAWPLFFGFLRWLASGRSQSVTHFYLEEYLKATRPKALLSAAYFSSTLYSVSPSLKKKLGLRLIVFQSSLWDSRSVPPVDNRLSEGDLVFAMTDDYVPAWRRIAGNSSVEPAMTIGVQHFRKTSNLITGSNFESNPKRAAWISVWRNNVTTRAHSMKDVRDPYELERTCLPDLQRICTQLGYEFAIVGGRKIEDSDQERNFYKTFMPVDGWTFEEPTPESSGYQRVLDFDLVFGAGSTLLYEAMVLGKHVFFVNTEALAAGRHPFGYPKPRKTHPLLLDPCKVSGWSESIVLSLAGKGTLEYRKLCEQIIGLKAIEMDFTTLCNRVRRQIY